MADSEAKRAESKLRVYLRDMQQCRGSGAAEETGRYSALKTLLDSVGAEMSPKVAAHGPLKDTGFGLPDFGLLTAEQLKRAARRGDSESRPEPPERGVIEVKALSHNLDKLIESEQTRRYLGGYGLVLATNYRAFALLQKDGDGALRVVERRELAASEAEFWEAPTSELLARAVSVCEFLRRAMMHRAPISTAKELARWLASYAREAMRALEAQGADAVADLRASLENALDVKFDGDDGDHSFHSTLVQTLFYGLFAAWLGDKSEKFCWRDAAFSRRVPLIAAMFSRVATGNRARDLGLESLLLAAEDTLNRATEKPTVGGAFGAIQHFYEPFLREFDKDLQKRMGVWYTPPEIVEYMVERVDRALREELQIPDGLADERVHLLDPCVGTGAFLAQALRRIRKTVDDAGGNGAQAAKAAAMNRAHGFEILPASYVVAHWQIGALLADFGAELGDDERASVWLTNALTGWKKMEQIPIPMLELKKERELADGVKRDKPILVVLGNPPYNAFAGIAAGEESGLADKYKEGLISRWKVKKFNLDDLYIRFFRIAENCVLRNESGGLVCYISNYSYIDKPSFVVMRERLLAKFDKIWIDSLNGDSRATGKKTPAGDPDPSIFSTEMNPAGIRVGTAIGLFVRASQNDRKAQAKFRNFWGKSKREDILASLRAKTASEFDSRYSLASPKEENYYSFLPLKISEDYMRWFSVDEISESVYNGPIERRGMVFIRFPEDKPAMFDAIQYYLDADNSNAQVAVKDSRLMNSSGEFDAQKTRKTLLRRVQEKRLNFAESNCAVFSFKPFDLRVAYLDSETAPLFSRPAPDLLRHRAADNWFFISRDSYSKPDEGIPVFASKTVCDYSVIGGGARHFPIRLHTAESLGVTKKSRVNLCKMVRDYLRRLGFSNLDSDNASASVVWLHALAICFSPCYLRENKDGVKIGWPRVPLPDSRKALERSALLGGELMRLLDSESPAAGIDSGDIAPRLKILARQKGDDYAVKGNWGYLDSNGRVMPSIGKIVPRAWTPAELESLAGAEKTLGAPLDIYLNGSTFWSGVPENAWKFRIGGYQVAKKWLSYREQSVLKRPLRAEEVRHFTATIRRLAAILLLAEDLDANYKSAAQNATDY